MPATMPAEGVRTAPAATAGEGVPGGAQLRARSRSCQSPAQPPPGKGPPGTMPATAEGAAVQAAAVAPPSAAEYALFRRRFHGFHVLGTLLYATLAFVATAQAGRPELGALPRRSWSMGLGLLPTQRARVMGTVACALIMWYGYAIDLYILPPPTRLDAHLLQKQGGPGAKFVYLTVNILALETAYWLMCVVAEVGALAGPPYAQEWWVLGATRVAYTIAVFVAAMGFMLTVLFLKFCWYEPKWRALTLVPCTKKNPAFPRYMLSNHVPSIVVAFVDILLVKDRALLTHHVPSDRTLALVGFAYSFVYVSWLHLVYARNGGVWPYPFMDVLFAKKRTKLVFVLGVTVAVAGMSLLYRRMALFHHDES